MRTHLTVIPFSLPKKVRPFQPKATYWLSSIFFLLAIMVPVRTQAQDTPRLQVFGGYSYLRFDSKTFGYSGSSNLHGWNASAAWNFTRNFGVAAELTGQYGNHLNLRDLAVGPQVLLPRGNMLFFAHMLIGKGRTFVSQGTGVGDTHLAYVAGGGVDMHFVRHFDIRLVQADFVRTELLQQTQNNVRISTGLVYHFGEIHRTKHRPPTTQAP